MYSLTYKLEKIKASSFKIDYQNQVFINFDNHIGFFDGEDMKKIDKSFDNEKITIVKDKDVWIAEASTGKSFIYSGGKYKQSVNYIATISSRFINYFSTEEYFYPTIYLNGDFSISYYARVLNRDYSIVDVIAENLGYKHIRLVIDDNSFVSCGIDKIGVFDFDNNKIWRFKYSDFIKSDKAILHSQILSFNGKLFFVIDGNDNRGLFVLDVKTGRVLKKFEGLCYELFQDYEYIYTTHFENILYRIDAKTLEIEEWDCHELIKSKGFESIHDHRCDIVNGKFFFTQSLGDNRAKLGVLDWEKKELVYKHDFEPKNGAIGSIHVSETRIFVHTQDNILHIFKEELP
ncbi:hypothetical protein GCM10011506_15910 [Marivirga lumbricoides]|uniref:Uncharacterized protein n=1 Tax=Marivirga lumbricoides TaxID=1046115 RepID=A0ABQ1M484_9BACT|nr:hypothetical protein GCM10011506_15910 [Marivirga lumbricoides]